MSEVPDKIITLESLEEMFQTIQADTDWDVSGDLLWGYFFTHSEPSKLEEAKSYLMSLGYSFVGIFLGEKRDKDDPDVFWMHIEKIETHSPESLNSRNDYFYRYANEFGLDSYDGMDVGPIEN